MSRNRISTYLVVALLPFFAACNSPTSSSWTHDTDLLKGTWVYYSYVDSQNNFARHTPKNLGRPGRITLFDGNKMTGNTPSNSLFGTYVAETNGDFVISYGSTLVGELPWGATMFDRMRLVDSYMVNDDSLKLHITSTGETLTFVDSTHFDYEAYREFTANDIVYEMDVDFLRYFGIAGSGSIWIYADQSGSVDTMTVSSLRYSYKYIFEEDAYYQWHSSIIKSQYYYNVYNRMQPLMKGDVSYMSVTGPFGMGYSVALQYGMYSPSCPDFGHYYMESVPQNCGTTIEHLTSLEVGNTVYRDILKLSSIAGSGDQTLKIGYYAKDIGLIRRVYIGNATFDLVEFIPAQ